MFHATKTYLILICFFIQGCGEGRWIEWDNKDNQLRGMTFKFTEPICWLKITPENPYSSSNIDIALGKYLIEQKYYNNNESSYECENIDDDIFTIVASYQAKHAWWLIDVDDYQTVVLENQQKVRSLASLRLLGNTTNSELNTISKDLSYLWLRDTD